MWCVGALAPWLAQGAGQLRRQGGSTCHPARPVITTSAVVLTRPPVPCHTNPRSLSVALGACTASPGRGTCVGGRRGGGQSAGEEEVAKITIRKRGEETTTTKGEQATNGGGKGGRGQGTPRRWRSICCCCWERDDDASPADSPRRCRSLCCCWKRDDDTSPANSPRRLFCCRCCVGAATRTPRTRCGGAPLVLLLLGEGRRRRARGPLLYGEVRRHLAGVCRHGEVGRAARQAARVGDAHPSTHRPVRLSPPSRRCCAS